MSDEPEGTREQISRRRALKRMAAAGAVAWAAPVVQTVNMQRAWAQNASPQRVCYRIKIESDGTCETGLGRNDCLDPSSPDGLLTEGGCEFFVSLDRVSDCIWTVTVDGDCEIVAATAKTGNECHEFDGSGTNSITIHTCQLDDRAISHVELAICCERSAQ
jgi:hypothetical protein